MTKTAQTIPDWAAKVFGKDLHSGKQHEKPVVDANLYSFTQCGKSLTVISSGHWTRVTDAPIKAPASSARFW